MSEDDAELGLDGQSTSRIDRDRRAPRFSWTPAYETTFFRSLCSSVQLGFRENSSFKTEAWERAAKALEECHSAFPTKSHLINKSDNARKRFRLWRGLRENPDFEYNPSTKTVTASEAAWKAHIEKEPLSRALRGRPFDHEEYMEILYPDVVGSGGAPKRVKRRRRRTEGMARDDSEMPEPDVLQLQTEHATSQSSPRLMRSSSGLRQATLNRTAGLRLMPTTTALARRAAPSSEKRQRTSTAGDSVARISASSSNVLSDTAMAHPPTWCELALEQFFSDFADESMELQIKIAENVLIHENKAMIFCKMPRRLRQHWVKELDEGFQQNSP
ncbi:hypothetical protein E4U30_000720 [Claviceps sp. LM220 group G6]|nr:hypothetical protein E4U30_000720 [Claviceps sp. LM220 group G6]